jgi:hypothetical protein
VGVLADREVRPSAACVADELLTRIVEYQAGKDPPALVTAVSIVQLSIRL